MKRLRATGVMIWLLFYALGGELRAQTTMDGSDQCQGCSSRLLIAMREAFRARVPDPLSTQWMYLTAVNANLTCGLYNTKNLNGAYVGFQRYAFVIDRKRLLLKALAEKNSISDRNFDSISEAAEIDRICGTSIPAN